MKDCYIHFMENKDYIKRHRFRKNNNLIKLPWLPDSIRPYIIMAIDSFMAANKKDLDKGLRDYLRETKRELKK